MAESPIELINPPSLQDEEQEKLRDSLEPFLPPGSEFAIPEQADKKQAIYMEDADRNRLKKAFVLYTPSGEDQAVRLLVLKQEDGSWRKAASLNTEQGTLDYFGLHDLDQDGEKEAVIGMAGSDFEEEKLLSVYTLEKSGLNKRLEQEYDLIDIFDYDNDGTEDVLLVNGKRRKDFTAALYSYKAGRLEEKSSLGLDAYVFHEHAFGGKLLDGSRGFYIDSRFGIHSQLPEIIAFRDGKLVKAGNPNASIQMKSTLLYTRDINDDGVPEVGDMYIPKGWEDAAFEDIPFIETYTAHSADGVKRKVSERYTDRTRRFYIEIPSEWQGRITPKRLEDGIQLLTVSEGRTVFEVRWADQGKKVQGTVLSDTKTAVFYTGIEEHLTFPFSQFHLLENEF